MKEEQGDSLLQWSMAWTSISRDNYMILFRNLRKKKKAFPELKTDDLSDTPNTDTKPSAFNLHTSCDLYYDRTK